MSSRTLNDNSHYIQMNYLSIERSVSSSFSFVSAFILNADHWAIWSCPQFFYGIRCNNQSISSIHILQSNGTFTEVSINLQPSINWSLVFICIYSYWRKSIEHQISSHCFENGIHSVCYYDCKTYWTPNWQREYIRSASSCTFFI